MAQKVGFKITKFVTISKEVLVIVLDIGKSMSEGNSMKLEGAIKAVNLLVQQKVIILNVVFNIKMLFGKNDEVALVLVGTTSEFILFKFSQ